MKLLYCHTCGSIFNLALDLKTCTCGKVRGRYINNTEAEVNGEGYSLALGNGSLLQAICEISEMKEDRRKNHKWVKSYPTEICMWGRPHDGRAHPHTKINPNL